MKKRRYSGNDWHLWPFTLSRCSYRHFGVMLDSCAQEDSPGDCLCDSLTGPGMCLSFCAASSFLKFVLLADGETGDMHQWRRHPVPSFSAPL
jgi:hypothetical protein